MHEEKRELITQAFMVNFELKNKQKIFFVKNNLNLAKEKQN